MGFHTPWSTKGKSCRFSPLWSNGPRLHGGNPIGAVPAASRGVSLIIKFYFVSFVLFVVIFLSHYNLHILCENVLYWMSLFLRSSPNSGANGVCAFSPVESGSWKKWHRVAKSYSPQFLIESHQWLGKALL